VELRLAIICLHGITAGSAAAYCYRALPRHRLTPRITARAADARDRRAAALVRRDNTAGLAGSSFGRAGLRRIGRVTGGASLHLLRCGSVLSLRMSSSSAYTTHTFMYAHTCYFCLFSHFCLTCRVLPLGFMPVTSLPLHSGFSPACTVFLPISAFIGFLPRHPLDVLGTPHPACLFVSCLLTMPSSTISLLLLEFSVMPLRR